MASLQCPLPCVSANGCQLVVERLGVALVSKHAHQVVFDVTGLWVLGSLAEGLPVSFVNHGLQTLGWGVRVIFRINAQVPPISGLRVSRVDFLLI